MSGRLALPEISTVTIDTARIATCVRFIDGRDAAAPVIFLHGNLSAAPFFFPVMRHLPRRYRPLAMDLRGFGRSQVAPVDATRGMRDFSDDVLAAMDALDIDVAHVVGWSLGGGVAMRLAIDAPERVDSLTLVAPISPYGFGGTTDAGGTLLAPDGAGSGAGIVGRRFLAALADGDTGDGSSSPRMLLRHMYAAPGWDGADEDTLVAAMLTTAVGDDNYPGDVVASDRWPGTAPGTRGVMNAMAPTHLGLTEIVDTTPKPPVLWIRGADDHVVSDFSDMDVAARGASGRVDGYPGVASAPPQPMVAQTRAVLEAYAAAGGQVREVVLADVGHMPHLEDVPRFLEAVVPHLDGAIRED